MTQVHYIVLIVILLLLAVCKVGITGPQAQAGTIVIDKVETDKVTYRSLNPEVTIKSNIKNASMSKRKVIVEFAVLEPITFKKLASDETNIELPPKIFRNIQATLTCNVEKMTGLLARVLVKDSKDNVLGKAMRPFDVTDDLRRNFRYAGGACYSVFEPLDNTIESCAGKYENNTFTPKEEVELVYDSFHNCAHGFTMEYRGHFTPWEESGDNWPLSLYGKKHSIMHLQRLKDLNEKMQEYGILSEVWMTIARFRKEYMEPSHPWIKRDVDGQPVIKRYDSYEMNRDLNVCRQLTPDQEQMMACYSHGAVNWIDYLVREYVILGKHIGFKCMWADNHATRTDEFIPMINMVEKELGYDIFIKSNCNERIGKDGITDNFWIETKIENEMTDQIKTMLRVLSTKRDDGVTLTWTNSHAGGPKEPYGKNNGSPKLINNDPNMTHMYRQYLFESISLHPDLVHVQNTPRDFTERYAIHKDAFREHCKTWGFQTLYTQMFNSPDIDTVLDSSVIVQIKGNKVSYDDTPEADSIHIRMASRPLLGQTIIHLFNYLGTETTNLIKRPSPRKHDSVTITVKLKDAEGKPVESVCAVSPDSEQYDDVYKPRIEMNKETLECGVPIDTYTLIVIQQ